jgi:ABC-type nitrate/sulfonate/bicarbonate transport system ATPase subunit
LAAFFRETGKKPSSFFKQSFRFDKMKIQLKDVSKSFKPQSSHKFTVLEGINVTINEGDFVVVLGESGSGKSTLLNMLAGLTPITGGEIRVEGRPVTGPHPSRSILFQQPSLLPWLNVKDNIVFGCKIRKDRTNLDIRALQLIEIMGLSGFENNYPPELSVGMAQRVCLARSLIGHPEILLLDEPFASLDTINRTRLQDELIEFWQIEQFTAVFVTHDIDEAITLGNRILLLGGRPTSIMEQIEIDLFYPRCITDDDFNRVRTKIFEHLESSIGWKSKACRGID